MSPRLLAPNEHLAGTGQAPLLLEQLIAHRADAAELTSQHPALTFLPLPVALRRWRSCGLSDAPFHVGLDILLPRYASLGLTRWLPLDRVLVGVQSTQDGAYGGFHHPNQGYRHLQMYAVITTAGHLDTGLPQDPELAALDLLRSYAHDCLHYGSFRSYRLRDDGQIVRTQYGLNFRRGDGRSYSAPDAPQSATTRNLGVVMEGACDREARLITQTAARRCGVTRTNGMAALVFREITGTLDTCELDVLTDPAARAAVAPVPAAAEFLRCMGTYHQGVNARYGVFLNELGSDDGAEDLHTLLLNTMISGDLRQVSAWLDRRHGPGAFTKIFKASSYSER